MSDYQLAFWFNVVLGSLIGAAILGILMRLSWRRRLDSLRQQVRELSAEKADLLFKYNDRETAYEAAVNNERRISAEMSDLRAQLAMLDIKEGRWLRPIDELAWETKISNLEQENRRLKTQLSTASSPASNTQRQAADRLTDIHGIGATFAERLNAAGISSYAQLAAAAPETLRSIVKAEEWHAIDPDSWILQASQLDQG